MADKSAGESGVAANEFALVFAGDDTVAPGLAVAMHSALANLAPAARLDVCILDSGLSESSRGRLERVAGATRRIGGIRWIRTPKERFWSLPTFTHVTPATYSRLLIGELLPRHIRRAVYLDADVLVRRDISPLFTIDLGGAPTAGVRDFFITSTAHDWSGVRERARPRPYFNPGVLAIDVARWRGEAIAERALGYAGAGEPLKRADMDALNALHVDWYHLDVRWNVHAPPRHLLSVNQPLFMRRRITPPEVPALVGDRRRYGDLVRAAWVLHFSTATKPWQPHCLTPGTAAWVRTLLRTRWYSPPEALRWLLRRHRIRLRYRLGTAKRQAWDAFLGRSRGGRARINPGS